jgi:glutathione synthase/RimK-type ligase-like ATP-grasp enzyme
MKHVFEFAQFNNQPVIEQALGILGDKGRRSKFGEQTGYFTNLLEKAEKLGVDAYVFTDFTPSGVTAWTIQEGKWVSSTRGLPKVFYNRSFRKRKYTGAQSSTRALAEMGCTPMNSADFRKLALDKQSTYESLVNEELGEMGLPYTEKYHKDGVIPFIQDHPSAILKPRFGSGGRGIIKLTKNGNGYEIQYKDYKINCPEDQLLERIDSVRQKMRTDKTLYIIQECIKLPKFNDSVFDVRVIYQKGANGSALRTGMAARIAAPNRVTANLHQGGGKAPLSSILEKLFNQDINGPIAQAIREYSKTVFEILDKKVGPIGEVGIDFLIDQAGKVHLIEVNSVPGRNLFRILPEIREAAIQRPIEYAKFLLFPKNKKEGQ